MTEGVIFSGPSLPRAVVEAAGFVWRPPVRRGDVAALLSVSPTAIGIVDGVFETVPTVSHREILTAMSRGVRVFGAASIGALRAAELDGFGMVGVGAIYAAYRDGTTEDDDEVALLHAPPELGSVALTQPMVNLRASVAEAIAGGRVPGAAGDAFIAACKAVFYKHRTPDRLAALQREILGEPAGLLRPVDCKRADAEALVAAMASARSRKVAQFLTES